MAQPVVLKAGPHVVIKTWHARTRVRVSGGSSVGDPCTVYVSGDHHRRDMVSSGYPSNLTFMAWSERVAEGRIDALRNRVERLLWG